MHGGTAIAEMPVLSWAADCELQSRPLLATAPERSQRWRVTAARSAALRALWPAPSGQADRQGRWPAHDMQFRGVSGFIHLRCH